MEVGGSSAGNKVDNNNMDIASAMEVTNSSDFSAANIELVSNNRQEAGGFGSAGGGGIIGGAGGRREQLIHH